MRTRRRTDHRVAVVIAHVVVFVEDVRLHPKLSPKLHAERLELARAE
jgi:hypothetical protein